MSDEHRDKAPDEDAQDASAEDALPAHVIDALDTLDRELRSVGVARWLKQRNLSPMVAQLAVRALRCYLDGDRDRAAQIFETIGEDLRDRTMQLKP
jgi:hypothetical protein